MGPRSFVKTCLGCRRYISKGQKRIHICKFSKLIPLRGGQVQEKVKGFTSGLSGMNFTKSFSSTELSQADTLKVLGGHPIDDRKETLVCPRLSKVEVE